MKKFIAFVLVLCCAGAVFAEKVEMPRFEIPTARSNGFGGSHIAYTDDVFALLINPAAIMQVRQKSFFTLSPTVVSPQKILDFVNSDGGTGAILESLNNPKNPGKIPLGLSLNELPLLSFSWVANGFGFGIWDRIHADVDVVGTTAEAVVLVDVVVPIGFAFKILDTAAHDVDAGVTLKFFGRGYGEESVTITDVLGDLAGIVEDIGAPVVAGFGMDLGFMYRWNIGLSAGITFDDIINHGNEVYRFGGGEENTDGYYVPFSMNLGVAYDFRIGNFWKTAPGFIARTGITAAFDWHNFDLLFAKNPYFKKNPVLGIGMGLQFSLADLVKVRIGMSEMLPAVGFGFDLGAIEIDLAYYGKELGLEPGQLPAAMLDVTLAIRPGAKARNWPWARTSLVETISKLVNKPKPEETSEVTVLAE
ncbi:MAG: hypothetical protein LBK61_01055 [Spirochaetaceae bacterium]|jgi:hypothetical protein|nr:hypothetical protein [Spirochaetaceae bacterium]